MCPYVAKLQNCKYNKITEKSKSNWGGFFLEAPRLYPEHFTCNFLNCLVNPCDSLEVLKEPRIPLSLINQTRES